MKRQKYHISGKHGRTIGIIGDLYDAIRAEHPFEVLHAYENILAFAIIRA